jgi:hypothetical protein
LLDIGAHKVELVYVILAGRMDCHLTRRQPEDQPAIAYVNVWELQHISQERPIRFRIFAVDDGVGADDHCQPPNGLRFSCGL